MPMVQKEDPPKRELEGLNQRKPPRSNVEAKQECGKRGE